LKQYETYEKQVQLAVDYGQKTCSTTDIRKAMQKCDRLLTVMEKLIETAK
jgi:hypothetical protein